MNSKMFCHIVEVCVLATSLSAQAPIVQDIIVYGPTYGNPAASIAQGRTGLFYTSLGGNSGTSGYIYDFNSSGSSTTIYTAPSTPQYDGISGPLLATDGYFYGTIASEVTIGIGQSGSLYKLKSDGTFSILHNFAGSDGSFPDGPPIEASDGNLYGVTFGDATGVSTVYKYTRSGVFSVIYTTPGSSFANALVQGSDGRLLFTTNLGGAYGDGTVTKISTSGKLLSQYSFSGKTNGIEPQGSLIAASDGNYYGATYGGGTVGFGYGTVYKLTPSGQVSIVYAFNPAKTKNDGAYPGLAVQGSDGYLYGVTSSGGVNNAGTIFRISLQGTYQQLYSFPTSVGQNPTALMQSTSGLFYGSTYFGGTYGLGSVYTLNMGLGPFVAFVQAVGQVGSTVEILGQGFTGTTSVSFNGVSATSFAVSSDTYLTAVIPAGANTGPVVVTTPTQSLTSNVSFRIR